MDDVARAGANRITNAMDRVCEQVRATGQRDGFVTAAARRILEHTEW